VKRVWIAGAVVIAVAGIVGVASFLFGARALATMTAPAEDIQYPFEKGGGLVHVAVEDVFMGIGMLTGEKQKGDSATALTGSISFEPMSTKTQARLQVDGIRLIERTTAGEEGRIFELEKVYDDAMEHGLEPRLQFLVEKGKLPFVWENGENDNIFFVFSDIPDNLSEADLVITYNGKFPGKKHIAYYEDRLPVKRKTYVRN